MSLTIKKETARKLYPESPEWFRKQLADEFGEENLKERSFTDIKSFEDACDALGIKPESISLEGSSDEIAYRKLKVIIKAINGRWIPNWRDHSQAKWYPWFSVLSSGFGFSHSLYDYTYTSTTVGSRLCFETEEKCIYAANQFIDLYKEFLL